MEKYLLYHHPSILNWYLQTILSDLRVPHFIAGIRAVGIIDKVRLFWRHLESYSVCILEMSDTYIAKMKHKFKKWSKDAKIAMDKDDLLFSNFTNDDAEEVRHAYKALLDLFILTT